MAIYCMQDTFARALGQCRPSARATIGYLVYKAIIKEVNQIFRSGKPVRVWDMVLVSVRVRVENVLKLVT